MAVPSDTQREADIRTIVGGNFTADALGQTYREILARVTEAPDAYLDTFERMFLAAPPRVTELSRLFLPSFLQRVAPLAPARVRGISQRLLAQVETTARVVDQMIDQFGEAETPIAEDLNHRRRELSALANLSA